MGTPRILFAGGGSGGHLMPGIAVAKELLRRLPGCEIHFITSPRGIDSRILKESSFGSASIPMTPLRMRPAEISHFASSFAASMRSLKRSWSTMRPDLVVGLGGFTSVPVGLTAWRQGTPLVLLEQNVVPGRATAILSRLADRVCVSFEQTASHLPCGQRLCVTGNPVRAEISRVTQFSPCSSSDDKQILLVLGGSQGAVGLNSMVLTSLDRIRSRFSDWRVVHQTGERDPARVRAAYRQLGITAEVAAYFDDLPQKYREARLVISRAGATTLAELACCGRPAVLVPYPGSARNHQERNADAFVRAGAAVAVPEGTGAVAALCRALTTLLDDPNRSRPMTESMRSLARPDATRAVSDVILSQLAISSDGVDSPRRAA